MKKYFIAFIVSMVLIQCAKQAAPPLALSIENPSGVDRAEETIAIGVAKLNLEPQKINLANPLFINTESKKNISYQLVDLDQDGNVDEIVMQMSLETGQSKSVLIRQGGKKTKTEQLSKVYARFVPERKDDFAWENDKIAFRMYGPALEAQNEISSGIDVWVKSVSHLILDKWYAGADYHKNHGEGLDCYKVGPSRGCGGLALWDGAKMIPSKNFISYKIIANGPLRTIFELTYAPWEFNGHKVAEVKRITLDAGKNLNRIESIFTSETDIQNLNIAVGIVKREREGIFSKSANAEWMAYWEPQNNENGHTGCGIILNSGQAVEFKEIKDHYLLIAKAELNKPFVYYAGAGWSKSANFDTADDWRAYIEREAQKIAKPIIIQAEQN
jgi:hypothetical protein